MGLFDRINSNMIVHGFKKILNPLTPTVTYG